MVTHASNVEMAPPKPQLSVLRRKPTDVEIQLKNLAEGSEKAWTTNKLLLKAVEELPAEVAKLKSGQETMVNRLDDLASANDHVPVNRKYKCTFCESDEPKESVLSIPTMSTGSDLL